MTFLVEVRVAALILRHRLRTRTGPLRLLLERPVPRDARILVDAFVGGLRLYRSYSTSPLSIT